MSVGTTPDRLGSYDVWGPFLASSQCGASLADKPWEPLFFLWCAPGSGNVLPLWRDHPLGRDHVRAWPAVSPACGPTPFLRAVVPLSPFGLVLASGPSRTCRLQHLQRSMGKRVQANGEFFPLPDVALIFPTTRGFTDFLDRLPFGAVAWVGCGEGPWGGGVGAG